SLPLQGVPVHRIRQKVTGDVPVAVLLGIRSTLVDDAATGDVAALEAGVRQMLEVAVTVWIVQGTVLAEVLEIIAALHLMQTGKAAPVGAGDEVAVRVEVHAPGVAAALGEQLELLRPWVITPDALLELDAPNLCRHRAALRPVKPAVWSPLQGVGEGMGVLH